MSKVVKKTKATKSGKSMDTSAPDDSKLGADIKKAAVKSALRKRTSIVKELDSDAE